MSAHVVARSKKPTQSAALIDSERIARASLLSIRTFDNPLFVNLSMFGGTKRDGLAAALGAGFVLIEASPEDLTKETGDSESLREFLQAEGISLLDVPVATDFDGACDARRAAARAEALRSLDFAVQQGARMVLTPASAHPDCIPARVDDDLRWFAREAGRRGLRVAYEPTAWSTFNSTLPSAWQCIRRVHEPNLGLALDVFQIFVRGRDAEDLDGIPTDRIWLVQLSDLAQSVDYRAIGETSRHRRLLPGQGHFPIESILSRLRDEAYRGPIGLEVTNDRLLSRDPSEVAKEAMAALRRAWLG